MDSMIRNKKSILLFLMPALLIYLGIVAVPVFSTVYYSFHKWSLVDSRRFIGFNNFVQLFTIDKIFSTSLNNTLLLLVPIVIQVPLAIFLAVAISGVTRSRDISRLFSSCKHTGKRGVGLLWSFIYNAEFGLINRLLIAVEPKPYRTLACRPKTVLDVSWWSYAGSLSTLYDNLLKCHRKPPSLMEMATMMELIRGKDSGT